MVNPVVVGAADVEPGTFAGVIVIGVGHMRLDLFDRRRHRSLQMRRTVELRGHILKIGDHALGESLQHLAGHNRDRPGAFYALILHRRKLGLERTNLCKPCAGRREPPCLLGENLPMRRRFLPVQNAPAPRAH